MSGLFGGGAKAIETSAPVITSFRLQTSAYGRPIAWIFGRTRVSGNMLDYDDFTAIPHTTTTSSGGGGGKGGGGAPEQRDTTYTYRAAVIIALGRGPLVSLGKIWKGKELQNASDLGLSFYLGDGTQVPFGYMTTNKPSKALGYRGIAYVASGAYDLGDNAELPNHNFEVQAAPYSGAIVDANPKDVLSAILTEGLGWSTATLANLTTFSNYCVANGLFISPAYTEQETYQAVLERLMQIGNAGPLWSEDQLKIVPFGDKAITGNSVTYTPNLTPLYDLTDDDFLNEGDDEPVRVRRSTPEDAWNQVTVMFYDRAKDYNANQATAQDLGNIQLYGLKPMQPIELNEICDGAVAQRVADLILRRELYTERNMHEFRLGQKHCLLEPGDLVTVPDQTTGEKVTARLWKIDEDPVAGFQCEAKEFPFGSASAALYGTQPPGGYNLDFNVAPGNVNPPIIFVAPLSLSPNWLEVWMAISGGPQFGGCEIWCSEDNASYKRLGTFAGKSRTGITTSAMNIVADPDETTVLGVNLTQSAAELNSGTQADADNANTLCYAGGELIAYRTATLTAVNQYNLTGLRRGVYGSTPKIVPIGAPFARLDEGGLFKYAFPPEWNGRTVYLKFVAFNRTGGGLQDIATLSPTTYTLSHNAVGFPAMQDVTGLALEGGGTTFTGRDAKFKWDQYVLGNLIEPHTDAYKVEVWSDTGSGLALRRTEYVSASSPRYIYTFEKNFEDHAGAPKRAITLKVWRRGAFGDARQISVNAATLAVSNPPPAVPTGIRTFVGADTITISCTPANDSDFAGLDIWLSAVSGFTPGPSNIIYSGRDAGTTASGLAPRTAYYMRLGARDTFDASVNLSSEFSATTLFVAGGIDVVGTLPAAGTQGRVVYLTSDGKLYRDSGTAWSKAADGADLLANSVTVEKLFVSALSGISANLGAITSGTFTLDPSGYIRGGQTGYNTGTGFWLGFTGANYKFSLGNPAGNYLTYDGTTLTIRTTLDGADLAPGTVAPVALNVSSLSAISANMGSITSGNITLNTSGYIRSGQTAYDTGTGWWIGHDGGVPKLSLGSSTTNRLTWEPTAGLQGRGNIKDTRNYAPGTIAIGAAPSESAYDGSVLGMVKQIAVVRSGTLTAKFNLKATSGSAYGQIWKNNAAYGTYQTNVTNAYVTYTQDIVVSAGDKIQLFIAAEGIAGVAAKAMQFVLYCAFSDGAVATVDVTQNTTAPAEGGGAENDSLHPYTEITMAGGTSKKWLIDLRPGDIVRSRDPDTDELIDDEVVGIKVGILGNREFATLNGRLTATPGHILPQPDREWAVVDPECYAKCSYGETKTVKTKGGGMLEVLSQICFPGDLIRLKAGEGMEVQREDLTWEPVETIEMFEHPAGSHVHSVYLKRGKVICADSYWVGTLA